MAIEIVDFPMKNGGSFHCYCYVSSPEGIENGGGRVHGTSTKLRTPEMSYNLDMLGSH